jgi:hypothetical protein
VPDQPGAGTRSAAHVASNDKPAASTMGSWPQKLHMRERPVDDPPTARLVRSVDAVALLRGLSVQQRTGPAPVALSAEELHPLYLILFFHVIPSPGQGLGVVGEIALVNDIAHPIEKPIAGHADQPSSPPARALQLSARGRVPLSERLWRRNRDALWVVGDHRDRAPSFPCPDHRALVAEEDDPVAGGPGLSEPEVDLSVRCGQQGFAPSNDDRVDIEPVCSDQVLSHEAAARSPDF